MRRFLGGLLALALALCAPALGSTGAADSDRALRANYAIDVNLAAQVVTVYAGDARDESAIVRQMVCSSGVPDSPDATPCGSFVVKQHYPDERGEWYYIEQYGVYVQYVTRFNGPYLFHSLPYFERDVASIDAEARSRLGTPASHGCIRLRSEDARWLAENCPDGTPVEVRAGEANEALRLRLLRRGYDAGDWPSYRAYLDAEIHAGLTGALEARRAD